MAQYLKLRRSKAALPFGNGDSQNEHVGADVLTACAALPAPPRRLRAASAHRCRGVMRANRRLLASSSCRCCSTAASSVRFWVMAAALALSRAFLRSFCLRFCSLALSAFLTSISDVRGLGTCQSCPMVGYAHEAVTVCSTPIRKMHNFFATQPAQCSADGVMEKVYEYYKCTHRCTYKHKCARNSRCKI